MAKVSKKIIEALNLINTTGWATEAVGKPLLAQNLIAVDVNVVEGDKAKAWLTDAGKAAIAGGNAAPAPSNAPAGGYQVLSGITLPESKRGFGRVAGPPKYPFATMEVGQFIFISNADTPDAAKKLASAVSNANNKYRTPTGENVTKVRTKRGEGNKAELDANGNKIKETVNVPVYKSDRKFTIRPVSAGVAYGAWTAPADGAVIARVS